jgi:SPP1 gp7 family putative phage head morphogenesis protein
MVELAGRAVGQALGSPQDRNLSIGEAVSNHNKGELAEDFGRIAKVQPEFRDGHTEQRLRAFARENLDLVRDVDRQPFDELSDELVQAVREGKRPEAIQDVVRERLDVTESRAERIARDQVSKLNSDFNRVRQRENGIERYEWMSAADRRVRTSHAFLHGQIRRWSNPHPTEGHPGDPINCRCVARGIVADVIDGQQAESKAPQFEVPDFRDRRYSYNPHWPTDGKAEYAQNAWVHGSWNEEPTALKKAAAREFGFDEGRVWNPRGHEPDEALVEDMTDVVAHQYEKAQAELDRRGIDSVTLYRGLSETVEEQGVLSSWTQSKEVAESFDDFIVEEEIPAERVLFFKGGPSWEDGRFGNQEEWVVLPEEPGEAVGEVRSTAVEAGAPMSRGYDNLLETEWDENHPDPSLSDYLEVLRDDGTSHSERLADALENGELNYAHLSDDVFEGFLTNKFNVPQDEVGSIAGYTHENLIMLRDSAPKLSTMVHEGLHGLEWLRNRRGWSGLSDQEQFREEFNAFLEEFKFMESRGYEPAFQNQEELIEYVREHYFS